MNIFFYGTRLLLLISLAVLVFLVGCGVKKTSSDRSGLVITSPELAETILYLAGPDQIKGVTIECNYPQDFDHIPKVGSFGKIDIEKIIALNPEAVYITGLEQDNFKHQLGKLGIKTETFYINSLQQFIDTVVLLGVRLGCEEKAADLTRKLMEGMAVSSNQNSEKPRVYVEIYGNPLMSVADSSLVGELVEVAGGDNIFEQLPRAYSRINPEELIQKNPEIIIITYPGITAKDVKSRKGWDKLSAVKNGRIYTISEINPDLILRASPRILDGLDQLKRIINE